MRLPASPPFHHLSRTRPKSKSKSKSNLYHASWTITQPSYALPFHPSSISSSRRPLSSTTTTTTPSASNNNNDISPRFLSDTKARLGKCIQFGLSAEQVLRAAAVSRALGEQWRELVCGSEGFLTGLRRAGLKRRGVEWGEMDSMGHVNNVVYNRYAESARMGWASNIALHVDPAHKKQWSEMWTSKGDGLILRSIRTDYKFPMTWPDHISVFHKLRTPPSASSDPSAFILDVIILSEKAQRPAARCVEDIVVYDYRLGKKAAMKPFMVEAFETLWTEQEEAKRVNSAKVMGLLKEVERLEKESWDREDAVEDFGGARK